MTLADKITRTTQQFLSTFNDPRLERNKRPFISGDNSTAINNMQIRTGQQVFLFDEGKIFYIDGIPRSPAQCEAINIAYNFFYSGPGAGERNYGMFNKLLARKPFIQISGKANDPESVNLQEHNEE